MTRNAPLNLAEDTDGTMTPAPPSQAWIGYDTQALYIAMRHPVNNAATLLPSSHSGARWMASKWRSRMPSPRSPGRS